MSPAGSGRSQFRAGSDMGRADRPPPGRVPPRRRELRVTIEEVESLLDHAQCLADSRPPGGYSVARYVEADQFGDIGAIGAFATIAARDVALSPNSENVTTT